MSTHLLLSSSVFSNFHNLTRAQTHLLTLQSYTLGNTQCNGRGLLHVTTRPCPPHPCTLPAQPPHPGINIKGKDNRKEKKKEWSISYPSVPDVFQRVMVDESPADRSRACRLHCRSHYAIASVMLETG